MLFKNIPIQKKLMRIILLISGVMLLVTSSAFFAYEFYAFRQTTIQKLSTLAKVIAANSTAALAFDNHKDAYEILLALKAEPHIIAASLYDNKGNLFSQYPGNLAINNFPVSPGTDGFNFSRTHLEGFQPVAEGNRRLGTLYLKSDLGEMYERFRLYGIITMLVIGLSLVLAYFLSNILQKSISKPILALAETAKTISVKRDYSVRAVKSGEDELGSLTDSFNEMLQQIQEQNNNLKESNQKLDKSEKQYHYIFENSPMPMWVIDLNTFEFLDVNEMATLQYGYSREEFLSMTTLDIRPDEDKELFKQADHLFEMSTTNYSKGMWNHRKKDGTIIQVETIAHKIIFEGVPARLILSNDVTERKKAGEKLDKSEKLFRAMIEKDADMKTLATPDRKVFYASPSITKILGYENQEFMTIPAFDLIHPDDVPGLIEGVSDIVQTPGKSFYLQQRLKHKNGTWLWCEGTITNMLHEPAVAALVANFRDITERKKLEEQHILFASIVNSTHDAIVSKTLNGKITSWNRGAEKIFGYCSKEIVGKHISILIPPHLQHEENEIIQKVRKGEVIDHYETTRITKDGKALDVSLTISPIRDSLGNIIGASKILRDISEQKIAGENLQKSLREISDYKYALDESSIVAITDQKGIIKYVNNNFCSISKYSADELLGHDHRIINSAYHTKEFIRKLWVMTANGRIWRGELKDRAKDGTTYWVDITIVPFLNEQGKPYQYVAISADITGRKLAEEENRKLNEDLELRVKQRTEELEAFSYSISHDLRAPLRAINGFAKMLGEDYGTVSDSEGKRLFNRIEENAKKMGLLIDNLLEFSRLGRKEIHKSPMQMTELAEAALLEINTTVNHNAAVKIHQLHPANADHAMIKQVMINLLSNAIKYSSKTEKPSIEIKSHLEENEIIYSVSDNGVGFNNRYVDKLFGVFQRLHLQSDFEGTGVGLALVKRIIIKHGGRVWAEGELNRGATFSFSLPAGNRN